MDKKMLRESRPGRASGPVRAAAGADGLPEYPRGDHDGPVSARDRQRREVLLRVVRISETLNQRLAL